MLFLPCAPPRLCAKVVYKERNFVHDHAGTIIYFFFRQGYTEAGKMSEIYYVYIIQSLKDGKFYKNLGEKSPPFRAEGGIA
ncbi:MAG: hypothetical protein DRN83_03990 [Hadesarchaea archaeon]|nr:MAG: hypothetical protein DRN83_03990 [Hadesarchaea archaeon]